MCVCIRICMYVFIYIYIYAYAHILIHLLSEDYGSKSSPESGQRLQQILSASRVPRGSPSGDRGGEKWMRFPALWQAKVAWFTDQNPKKWLEQWKPLNFQGLQRSFNREA